MRAPTFNEVFNSAWGTSLARGLVAKDNEIGQLKQQLEERDRTIAALTRKNQQLEQERDYYQGCVAQISEQVRMFQVDAPEVSV